MYLKVKTINQPSSAQSLPASYALAKHCRDSWRELRVELLKNLMVGRLVTIAYIAGITRGDRWFYVSSDTEPGQEMLIGRVYCVIQFGA